MIKKVESSKYTILEAYKDITKADFKCDSAGIKKETVFSTKKKATFCYFFNVLGHQVPFFWLLFGCPSDNEQRQYWFV